MKKIIILLIIVVAPFYSSAQYFTNTPSLINNGSNDSRGSSLADFDNDGDLDLFITNVGSTTSELFYNQQGVFVPSVFVPGSPAILSNINLNAASALWVDFDNDGDLDLFIANGGSGTAGTNERNQLFENTGSGFIEITTGTIVNETEHSLGSAWVDYDNDGDLDIYITSPSANSLYDNNGNGTFTKNTTSIITSDANSSSTAAWSDYDNDGDMDLYVTNTDADNVFFINNGTSGFTKVNSGASFVDDGKITFGASWGDFNNDGYMDLFIANSSSTNSGQTNNLFKNNADGTFTEISTSLIGNETSKSESSEWLDYDNDGHLDLIVINVGSSSVPNKQNFLYHNNGDETFTKITSGDIVTDNFNSKTASANDLNGDGYVDIVMACRNGQNVLYLNDGGTNHYAQFKLEGVISNRKAIGAKIKIKCNIDNTSPIWQYREVKSNTDRGTQSGYLQNFGLGTATIIDSVVVSWPSGGVCTYTNVDVDSLHILSENCHISINENALTASNLSVYPNPSNGLLNIKLDNETLNGYTISVINTLGQVITTEQVNAAVNYYQVDISNSPKGIYFLTLEKNGYIITEKLIIE